MSAEEFFEYFVADQVLKDFDLSVEEMKAGLVDGGGDGGIDGIYVFVNGHLLAEDSELDRFRKEVAIEVVCIQAKHVDGFAEDSLNRLRSSAENLFDLSKPLNKMTGIYNESLLKVAKRFREAYQQLASKLPEISIRYYYATKGSEPHPNVLLKVNDLEASLRDLFSDLNFSFSFIGNADLVAMARKKPRATRTLVVNQQPMQSKGAFICLASLDSLHDFVTDDGKLARQIFDSNVRDHQGKTEVNSEIQETLRNPSVNEEFWWLNNGITVLCKSVRYDGSGVLVEDPQIVNGVQTSTEIFNYFQTLQKTKEDERTILVRVIAPRDEESQDRIIKATNSQNAVAAASLRSTDKIHRDIEQYFAISGLFYDRRKNFSTRTRANHLLRLLEYPI